MSDQQHMHQETVRWVHSIGEQCVSFVCGRLQRNPPQAAGNAKDMRIDWQNWSV